MWVDIKGYEGLYQVSDTGLVRNRYGRLLKACKRHSCYPKQTLSKDGYPTYHLIRRLVASTFIPNPLNLPELIHLDNDRQNNKAINLVWATTLEYRQQVQDYIRDSKDIS